MNEPVSTLLTRFRSLGVDERRALDAVLTDDERDELYPLLTEREIAEIFTDERIAAGAE
jgi:hypothetical protein